MADSDKTFRFDAAWNMQPVKARAVADSDQITIIPSLGNRLEIPLETFAHLFSTLMIAAHSKPSD